MKILILSITCGDGHNAIARALKKEFNNTNQVEIFDIFSQNSRLSKREHNAYMWCLKYIPKTYDFFWNKLRTKNPKNRYSLINTSYIKKIYDFNLEKIKSFQPDAVVCTHNYASNLMCVMKMNNDYRGKIYSVLFDYVVCPFWETSVFCDAIFTPDECTHAQLVERGFKASQLVPLGFPVAKNFEINLNKEEERKKFGFKDDDFVVMSMGGGFSQGNSLGLCKALKDLTKVGEKNIKIKILCSKNEKKKKQIDNFIKKNHLTHMEALGFLPRVDELMSASNLVFTRGGCNTLNEILHMGVVPVIREKLVTNETINKKMFIEKNMAFGMSKLSDAPKILEFAVQNNKDIQEKQENIKKFVKHNAGKNIASYILSHV